MNTKQLDGKSVLKSPYFLPLSMAALWNLCIGTFGLIFPEKAVSLYVLELTPLTELATSTILWCFVVVAGLAYGIVAFAHDKLRFVITIGAILNVGFFFFVGYLWLNTLGTSVFFLAATVDLILAIVFVWFLYQTKEYGYF